MRRRYRLARWITERLLGDGWYIIGPRQRCYVCGMQLSHVRDDGSFVFPSAWFERETGLARHMECSADPQSDA